MAPKKKQTQNLENCENSNFAENQYLTMFKDIKSALVDTIFTLDIYINRLEKKDETYLAENKLSMQGAVKLLREYYSKRYSQNNENLEETLPEKPKKKRNPKTKKSSNTPEFQEKIKNHLFVNETTETNII